MTAFAAPAARRQCAPSSTIAPPPPTTTDAPEAPSSTSDPAPPTETSTPPPSSGGSSITAEQLIAIDAAVASCDNEPIAGECRDAKEAAPFINASFDKYEITSVGEKAALLSLIFFETGALKYDRNHFPAPGRPGQGTRNLMMFPGVWQYASTLPETADKAKALLPSGNADSATDEQKNAVRELVLGDELSFASAAWYYKTNCGNDAAIVEGLKAETQAGWEAYITKCVYTTAAPERQTSWAKALEVLKSA
jgi:hypothetical protein